MIRQFELVERVQSYDPDADEDMLNRAYVYGLKKHGTQLRASGDPYFSHPVEVAGIRSPASGHGRSAGSSFGQRSGSTSTLSGR